MAVWNSMSKEEQMQVRKWWEQQGIKPASTQPRVEAGIAAIEAHLQVNSQPEDDNAIKKKESHPGKKGEYPVTTSQVLGGKCKEPDWLLVSLKGDANIWDMLAKRLYFVQVCKQCS